MACEIIAEISGNHGGDYGNALELIDVAKVSGATGVKFQCFEPVRLANRRVEQKRIHDMGYTEVNKLIALYLKTHTPPEWFPGLISRATVNGLTWHASVFDPEDVEFLEALDCPRYKIASFESGAQDIRNAVSKTGKSCIISANQHEDVIPESNCVILHATDYGVTADKANLNRLRHWHDGFVHARLMGANHFKWGLSDHTLGFEAAAVAAVMGASMIERHLMLLNVETPDDAFSLDAISFRSMVNGIRTFERVING